MKNVFPCEYGHYLLLDRCGSGGMAEVFRAITRDSVSRLVVIKKSHSMIKNDPQIRNMFLDEIKISARMNHPNIVHLNSYGSGGEYIELEYVYGKTINDIRSQLRQRGKSIPIPVALFIAHEVAKGLCYAHGMKDELTNQNLNIVHRDISPQNIMLSFSSQVKILDFGIAKVANNLAHTQNGVLKGKPFYMSPEQALGSESVDFRTDIFSLGVVLWNMITNQKLFAASSSAEYLMNLDKFEIKDPREYNSECSESLSRIIMKALEHNPQDRYPSIDAFRREIYDESTLLYEGHSIVPEIKSWIETNFSDEIEREKGKLQNLLSQAKIYMNKTPNEDTEQLIPQAISSASEPDQSLEPIINSPKSSPFFCRNAIGLIGFLFILQGLWLSYRYWDHSLTTQKIRNVEKLVSQKNWNEALTHLKKIEPKKRNNVWKELLSQVSIGLIKQRSKETVDSHFIKNLDSETYAFTQLIENQSFLNARSELTEKAMKACLDSGSLECTKHLSKVWDRAPLSSASLFRIADQVTYFYFPRFALPIYAQAHRFNNEKQLCENPRQALAVSNLLSSYNKIPQDLLPSLKTVALKSCTKTFYPEVYRKLSRMPKNERSSLCKAIQSSRSPASLNKLCPSSQRGKH